MSRTLNLIRTCGLGLLASPPLHAHDFDLSVDLRAVSSDATSSRLDGGLGAVRYDADHDGVRLGYVRFGYRAAPTQQTQVTVEGAAYGDHDKNVADLTEIWAGWRSLPHAGFRSRVKLGAFWPEVSLENRMRGWRSPYTLSYSAINSWIGEELRTIGAEYAVDWLGQQNGHGWNFSANAAVFGWNDPAGTVLATNGWGLGDRPTTLFGRFANRGSPLSQRTLFYDDMDKRAGYYWGLSANYRGTLQFTGLHYDNRADPAIYSPAIDDVAWLTIFNSEGVRWTPNDAWTVIAQRIDGYTYANEYNANAFKFWSDFVLGSYQFGRQRISARYDRFYMDQTRTSYGFQAEDEGHAWTFAWQRSFGEHWNLTLEQLTVTSHFNERSAWFGEPDGAREHQFQLAVRYDL